MKKSISLYRKYLPILVIVALLGTSCDDFVTVDVPGSQLTSPTVFDNLSTADAAVSYIYGSIRDSGLLSGSSLGLSAQMGLYTDELDFYGSATASQYSFYTNSLLAENTGVSNYWSAAYRQIYAANAVYEGLSASQGLNPDDVRRLQGEALFIRGLLHFYLTTLYGDIPYVTATDYRTNAVVTKIPAGQAIERAITDLLQAIEMLPPGYTSPERARAGREVAQSMLARLYLYAGMWEEAAATASLIIDSNAYSLAAPEGTFLNQSPETIWQLPPATEGFPTLEAGTFTLYSAPPQQLALSVTLLSYFDDTDLRKTLWMDSVSEGGQQWFFPAKYRQVTTNAVSTEYSVMIRLAELLLIRAEAYARLGNVTGALTDLNQVRERAGLGEFTSENTQELLQEILNEGFRELFSEQAHRFFDLKRFGMLDSQLQPLKPGWDTTDSLLPIPATEINLNPNLLPQNPGY